MTVTLELIDRLYKVKKICIDVVQWQSDNAVPFEHHYFDVDLVTQDEHAELLKWRGWYQVKYGLKKWGFKILYQRRYDVRSWDMAKAHKSNELKRKIRGVGQHKHYYLDEANKHATCEIPAGEISIIDPNQAVLDFCAECNIELLAGYQTKLFP